MEEKRMELEIKWLEPFDLGNGAADGLIYSIPDLDQVPTTAGVYVFARVHGQSVAPLYVGKADNLARRIEQQLNNVRLMRGIEDAVAGYRILFVGEFVRKQGQKASSAVKIIESALIKTALVGGFDILNIRGAKTPVHTIASRGNREARRWLRAGSTIQVEK